jgi:hypothetical protein
VSSDDFGSHLRPVSGEPQGRFGHFFFIVTVETLFLPACCIGRVALRPVRTHSIATCRRVMQVESQPDQIRKRADIKVACTVLSHAAFG